jgi:hypothetical protein
MKIAFYTPQINERGTSTALADYARYNKSLLGNDSLVIHHGAHPGNLPGAVARFEREFEVISAPSVATVEKLARAEGCDLIYVIKPGRPNAFQPRDLPMMVHAVFDTPEHEAHGASFAYVSHWLARTCSANRLPFVPHVCTVSAESGNLRAEMGIPEGALVFGAYGIDTSMSISFTRKRVIPRILEERADIWFAFMNITPFIDHPRVIFRGGTVDPGEKAAFINSVDAMLHARDEGESFGLSVAEFALKGKPILTWSGAKNRGHLDILGQSCLRYENARELMDLLRSFDPATAPVAAEIYRKRFSPEVVMRKFNSVFVVPALLNS